MSVRGGGGRGGGLWRGEGEGGRGTGDAGREGSGYLDVLKSGGWRL